MDFAWYTHTIIFRFFFQANMENYLSPEDIIAMADLALAKFSVAISSTHHDVDVDDDEDEDDDVWANCGTSRLQSGQWDV